MARLIRWKLGNHGVRTGGTVKLTSAGGSSARYPYGDRRRFRRILGHRDTGLTSCPGEQLYYQLSELRERVGERRPAGEEVEMTAPLPELITYSREGSTYFGTLTDAAGLPVAGATVELQRLRRTGWRPLEDAITDEDGNFAATTRFKRQTVLRWEFAGDDVHRPFRGDGAAVAVAPLMTLETSTTDTEPGERIDVSGTIAPAKSEGLRLVIQRDEAGRWRRVARRKVTVRDGAFTRRVTFDAEGTYRLAVRFAGDLLNAPSATPYVEVTVEEPFVPF
jgi:hypothetical protein